jgi:DNA-binding NarL/FixJ family response regulator
LAGGLTNKQIAEAMHISSETVKDHVQRIFVKIGVTDRTQAAVWAVRNNLA